MRYDRLMASFTQVRSGINKSCARRVARSRRVLFSAGEAGSLSLLLLRLGTYNKYHISFQLLPIFSSALRYRWRIWRRSL